MYKKHIKEIRAKLNLSVAKMAEKINIPARTITGYERGERMPSIEFVAQCCTILNVNANWFLTGEGEMFNPAKIEGEISYDTLTQKMEDLLRKHKLID